jgi:signal transduction histidine kinase
MPSLGEAVVRRVPIRFKLALALALPLVALVVVTVLEVVKASQRAEEIRDQTALAAIAVGPTGLLSDLEWERNAAGIALLGLQDQFTVAVEDPEAAAVQTDAAIEEFRAEVESQGSSVEEAYADAFAGLDRLDDLRAEVAAVPAEERTPAAINDVSLVFDEYTEIWEALTVANRAVIAAIEDPELRQAGLLVDLNDRQTNLVALLVRDMLAADIGDGEAGFSSPEEIEPVGQRLDQLRQNWRQMVSLGTGRFAPLVEDLLAAEEVQQFPQVVAEALETGTIDLAALVEYAANDDPDTLAYTVFAGEVENMAADRAAELQDAALRRQRIFTLVAAVTIVVAGLAIWLVSRSITRPLRSLTRQAKDMAERGLPHAVLDILDTPLGDNVRVPTIEPITVVTRDEVADVAAALNTVQDTALDLAVDHAVLRRNIADSFVNLGRRNQNLLGRQLDFITELETNEADPDTLANLFRLDHLATRMRRNAESLLVLAGIEPPRKWAAPVRLTDVIRAALGEVEDYQRVTVRGVEPATIIGSAAADLAHLLAELIENALVFSPPDQTVDIRGRNRPGAGDGDDGYVLAVIDGGLGMPSNDIAAANRRLAGAESFTIAPSKYLGHYVAGNLAARHNITVHLDNSPGNGITATIDIPPALLTRDSSVLGLPPTGPATSWDPGPPRGLGSGGPSGPPAGARPAGRPGPDAPPSHGTPPADVPAFAPVALAEPRRPPVPAPAPMPDAPAPPAEHRPGFVPSYPRSDTAATPSRTSGGLPRRSPGAAGVPGPAARRPADDDIVASLGRYTRGGDGGAAPATPPASLGLQHPRGEPGAVAADGRSELTRRVRGAQLPATSPTPLRRTAAPDAARRAGPIQRHPSADAVYRFLTDFTAGVQRGLDASRPDGGSACP